MPNGVFHRLRSLLLFGKEYAAVHEFMDAPAKVLGAAHRILNHDKKGIDYIRERWGDEAALAAQQHVIDDLHDTDRKILDKVNKMYSIHPRNVLPKVFAAFAVFVALVVAFTVLMTPYVLSKLSHQSEGYWVERLGAGGFDYSEFRESMRAQAVGAIVMAGQAKPEEYGESYASLGIDGNYVRAQAEEREKMAEWIEGYVQKSA